MKKKIISKHYVLYLIGYYKSMLTWSEEDKFSEIIQKIEKDQISNINDIVKDLNDYLYKKEVLSLIKYYQTMKCLTEEEKFEEISEVIKNKPGLDIELILNKWDNYKTLKENKKLVEIPYDHGQFVKVSDPEFKRSSLPDDKELIGSISGYTVFSDGILCWVSGYKESWCGEFMLEEITPLTEEEIEKLKNKRG